jgi:transposase InsO family protein
MCRLLGVSRSGYYAWRKRQPSKRSKMDASLAARIVELHVESHRRYGSPRVHEALKAEGCGVSRKRVVRLMRERGLVARPKPRFCTTTNSDHDDPIAPNVLARHFETPRPNTAWASDITYLATAEGWLYLAIILDLYSRRVVGWAMGNSLERGLCLTALRMALETRRPAPGLVHHSDRGTQYASADYQQLLEDHGLVCSMSRRGNCWDNAVAESFFSTLKTELVGERVFKTRGEATQAVFEYVEAFYNQKRLHSSIGYRSPADFEAIHRAA